MGDWVSIVVGSEEMEPGSPVDTRVVGWQVYLHQKPIGIEWQVGDASLVKPLYLCNSTDASDLVVDKIADGQS